MIRIGGNRSARLVSALCALSLILVSFAHRPIQADAADPELAAYLAAGGSLSDICGSPVDGTWGVDCPACIIAETIAQGPATPRTACRVTWAATSPPSPTALRVTAEPAHTPPARGPPLPRST